jgi:two-component system cell cycle sensor histidine kinase/response regulator CckA
MPVPGIIRAPAFGRLLSCLLLAASLAAADSGNPSPASSGRRLPDWKKPISERRPLIVGVNNDSFPYGYQGNDGKWTGFSADLLDAVARVMDLRVERVASTGPDLQRRFREGEFDLMQSLSQTPDREVYAEFSVPFLTLQGALFVRKSAPAIRKLEDLNGKRFAITGLGSIGDKFLHDHHLRIQPVYVASTEEALKMVESGDCAAAFASQLTALSVMKSRGIRDIRVFDRPFADYDIRHCFAVHRGDATLLARLNEGLAILQGSGEFRRIYNTWFGRLESPIFTWEQVTLYGAIFLAVAFVVVLAAFLHQRWLRRRIAHQADELAGHQVLLQALYDNIPYATCLLENTPEGYHVLSINRRAEQYFGVPSREAVGRLLRELPVNPEWAASLNTLLHRPDIAAELIREECRLEALHRQIVFTLVPLAPGTGGRTRLCLLAEDVTGRRELDEEIAQSRKMRAVGELVGGIAHEFNNLLTPIMLKTGEIRQEWAHDQRLRQEIDLISEVTQRAAELTRRLLTFGRRTEAHAEAVHLATVVDSCFNLLRLTVDRRIVWDNAVPASLAPLYISPTDVHQVVLNLVINGRDTLTDKLATEHSGWTPTIRIEAVELPVTAVAQFPGWTLPAGLTGWQRLTVRDNGMGMAPEVRERMFEPFYTTKEVGRGTGLGLAIVWQLLHQTGGRIEVESKPGEGTAFHVYFPVLPVPPEAKEPAPSRTPSCPPFVSARVLLVDDEDLVARTIVAVLQRAGHSVHRESDGAAAWQHLQERLADYDVLLFDMNMPGLSGLELAQHVRATGRYSGPIVILSGRLDSEQLEQLAAVQVTLVLQKPFEVAELQAAVRRCLRPAP